MLKTRCFDQPSRYPYENSASRRLFAKKVVHSSMKTPTRRSIFVACCLVAGQACAAAPSPDPVPALGEAQTEESAASPLVQRPADADNGEGAASPLASAETARDDAPREGEGSAGSLPVPENTKVLHVGDSFAGALGKPLGELFEAARVRSVLKHTDSSYLTDWAWDGNLQKYLWKYNPDLVIVTLGANELEIVNPELREKTVRKIVQIVDGRPCVWIAIPLWAGPKNGLLDVIKKNSPPCKFMDTNALFDTTRMARISDGIHPTTEARKAWADDVFDWLREHRKPMPERPWNIE